MNFCHANNRKQVVELPSNNRDRPRAARLFTASHLLFTRNIRFPSNYGRSRRERHASLIRLPHVGLVYMRDNDAINERLWLYRLADTQRLETDTFLCDTIFQGFSTGNSHLKKKSDRMFFSNCQLDWGLVGWSFVISRLLIFSIKDLVTEVKSTNFRKIAVVSQFLSSFSPSCRSYIVFKRGQYLVFIIMTEAFTVWAKCRNVLFILKHRQTGQET